MTLNTTVEMFIKSQNSVGIHTCYSLDFVKVVTLGLVECRDKVVDFHWDASDPWTVVSVSDDGESTGGGGTLQVGNTLRS